MINYIWFFMIFLGIIFAVLTGNADKITEAIVNGSGGTVTFLIELTGIMCFWCGVMKVAENSGLTANIAKLLKPLLRFLFKDAANSLGLVASINKSAIGITDKYFNVTLNS